MLLLAALVGAGCSTTSGLSPESTRSGFDGARVVTISHHGNACTSILCTGLGAQWTSANPADAILTVTVFNEFKGITGAALNIDGKITTIKPIGLTNFSRPGAPLKESSSNFAVPLQLLRSIAGAQRAWLRVHTTSGYLEDAIVDGATDSKALHAMRRFLAEVDLAQ